MPLKKPENPITPIWKTIWDVVVHHSVSDRRLAELEDRVAALDGGPAAAQVRARVPQIASEIRRRASKARKEAENG